MIRGHNMAKAAVEMAAWDLYAQAAGRAALRSCSAAPIATRIASGVSIGIQDSLDELLERVEIELAAGYRRIKIKIKPGWDVEAVETRARAVRRHPADGGRQRRLYARAMPTHLADARSRSS